MSDTAIVPNAAGLVPVEIQISEAGLGLRAGEVRGVSPETARRMIDKGTAKLVPHPKSVKPAAPAATTGV